MIAFVLGGCSSPTYRPIRQRPPPLAISQGTPADGSTWARTARRRLGP
jgi:hypothetical protein